MYVRHGSPFTDRLIFHDMFNRAVHHVHDTNEGDDTSIRFYLWQLGYALFPWTGLAPLGLMYWLRRSDSAEKGKGDAAVFLFMWFLFAFALVTFMGTKFHHYIFPAVPAVAMLVGIMLDQMLEGEEPTARGGTRTMYLVGDVRRGAARSSPGSRGCCRARSSARRSTRATRGAFRSASFMAVVGGSRWSSRSSRHLPPRRRRRGAGGDVDARDEPRARDDRRRCVAGALALLLVGRDLVLKPDGADQPGRDPPAPPLHVQLPARVARLARLLRQSCSAFTVVGAARDRSRSRSWRWRRHAVYAVRRVRGRVGHLGARRLHGEDGAALGAARGDRGVLRQPREPRRELVAYQMNWKGENFYTGNHVPAFVSTGSTFTTGSRGSARRGRR